MASALCDNDDDPFRDGETPPWLLRRGESFQAGEDDDDGQGAENAADRNPEKHSTTATTTATTPSTTTATSTPTSFLDLNRDCLTTILSSLPPASIASAALTCSLLANVAKQDALWRMKAVEDFGRKTNVDAWTRRGVVEGRRERRRQRRMKKELRALLGRDREEQPGGGDNEAREEEEEADDERFAVSAPENYLSLYRLLKRLDKLVGLWRDDSPGPCHAQALAERRGRAGRWGRGGRNNANAEEIIASRPGDLVAFSFSSRFLVGHRLSFRKPRGGQPQRVEVARLSPCSAAVAAEVVDSGRCVLRRRTTATPTTTPEGGGGRTREGGRSPSTLSGSSLPSFSGLSISGGGGSSTSSVAAGRTRAAAVTSVSPSSFSLLPSSLALGSSPSSTSAAAAAAAVAVGAAALDVACLAALGEAPTCLSSPMLGSSPVPAGSFEFEMMRFFGTSIRGGAAGGGGRAAAARRAAWALAERGGAATHLTRVNVPRPSRAHPLAGLWRGDAPGVAAVVENAAVVGAAFLPRALPPPLPPLPPSSALTPRVSSTSSSRLFGASAASSSYSSASSSNSSSVGDEDEIEDDDFSVSDDDGESDGGSSSSSSSFSSSSSSSDDDEDEDDGGGGGGFFHHQHRRPEQQQQQQQQQQTQNPHVISLSYDFAGPHARVVATRVATVGGGGGGGRARGGGGGDREHQHRRLRFSSSNPSSSSSEILWIASAVPLAKPWPAKDSALVAMRASLAGGDDHLGRRGGHVAAREVVEVSRGRGSVAAAGNAAGNANDASDGDVWCEGRLWRYADGGLAFVWLPRQPAGGERLVDYERVDGTREKKTRGSKKKRRKEKKRERKRREEERRQRRQE